jgi:TolB-like protein
MPDRDRTEVILKHMIRTCTRIWICTLATLLLLGSVWAAEADEAVKKIAIVPFTINAEKDLSFLQSGIADMLASRLSSDASEVISRERTLAAIDAGTGPLNESSARELGTRLGAQHVLFGSLTVFGEAVSIDAKMVDVAGQERPLSFFTQTESMGEVIPKINGFAEEINRNIFRREMAPVAPAAPVAAAGTQEGLAPGDVRAHPEKLVQQPGGEYGQPGTYAPPWQTEASAAGGSPNPNFSTSGTPAGGYSFWRSRNFDRRIDGMALGDVNGDGRTEIVIAEEHVVHLYHFNAGRLQKVAQIAEDKGKFYVSADVADINGNGTPEIFLSALNQFKSGMVSTVFEFDGQAYKPIVEDARWFFRVTKGKDAIPILLGQRFRGENPYHSTIHTMRWENGEYTKEGLIIGKNKANVLGAAYGELFAQGRNIAVAYSESDAIRVFSSPDKIGPAADEGYGGTLLDATIPTSDKGGIREFKYLPSRLIIDDLDGDGKQELVTVKNRDIAGKMMQTMRKFKKGQLVAINWDGLSLNEAWTTPKLTSYISDFAIGDLDGDGKKDLVASVVVKSGRAMFTKSITHLISYPLAP